MADKRYEILLTTLAPVHIGDGGIYNTKEYIYEDGHFYFPDNSKVFKAIQEQGPGTVKKYEAFLLKPSGNRNPLRLVKFLNDAGIKERSFGGYKIEETGLETEKDNQQGNITEVSTFIKDPYGKPFIPGSSLKGAIRTVIENNLTKVDNNLFKNILVSDSNPIETDRLMLARKWDYNKNDEKPAKPLPLYRESLKPFTRLSFTIVAKNEAVQIMDIFKKMAFDHYNHYYDYFLSEFPDKYIQKNIQVPIYIGAGSGFWTKVNIDNADPSRYHRRKGKIKMDGKGVLKLTRAKPIKFKVGDDVRHLINNNEKLYEMGKCNFLIKEVKGNYGYNIN